VFVDRNHLGSRLNSFLLGHVKRSVNMVTHFLNKFTLSSTDTIWIEECPPCIASHVATDLVV